MMTPEQEKERNALAEEQKAECRSRMPHCRLCGQVVDADNLTSNFSRGELLCNKCFDLRRLGK